MAIQASRDRVLRRLTEQAAIDATKNQREPTKSRARATIAVRRPIDFQDEVQGSPAVPIRLTFSPAVRLRQVTKDTRFLVESVVVDEKGGGKPLMGRTSFAAEDIDPSGEFVTIGVPSGEEDGDNGETVGD